MPSNSQLSHVIARRALALSDDTAPVGRRRGAIRNHEETASAKNEGTSQRHNVNRIVYIVGGGPGDPGLITVKGLNCLRRADVVLYDRLIAQELLNEVPTHAELIDVGKEPKRHRRSQDEINAVLIEKARVRALPRAARQLASRFGLPAATALEMAAAAGLNVEDDR